MAKNLNDKEQKRRNRFSSSIVKRINEKGWTKAELARQAGMGRDSIGAYIRTDSFPAEKHLLKLCKALDCTPDDLCPGSSELLTDMMPEIPLEIKSTSDGRLYFRIAAIADTETVFGITALLEKYHEKEKSKQSKK